MVGVGGVSWLLYCVQWDILRGVNFLLYPVLPLLFFSSSLSLFLSYFLFLLLPLPTNPSDSSLQTKAHGCNRHEARPGYEKGNMQTIKCNYRIDSSIAEDASLVRSERACGCETQKLQQADKELQSSWQGNSITENSINISVQRNDWIRKVNSAGQHDKVKVNNAAVSCGEPRE